MPGAVSRFNHTHHLGASWVLASILLAMDVQRWTELSASLLKNRGIMRIMLKRLGGAALIVGIAFAPLSANAERGLYSYQGGDYSYDYTSSYRIQISDQEDDGHAVRVEYKMTKGGESRYLYNYNGVNTSKYESLNTFPRAHRAIEILNNRPDAYGDWRYPT